MPACAKPYARAIDPNAVTIQESSDIAPTLAMLVGSMMIPEPIMFTATMNVSCTRFIFFFVSAIVLLLLSNYVGVEPDTTFDRLLVHPLDFVAEAREAVEGLFEGIEVIEHRSGALVPALAGNYHAYTRWINECERRRNTTLDRGHWQVVDFVGHELLVGVLRRHRELGEAFGPEAGPLQRLDVGLPVERVHLVAHLADGVARIAGRILDADGRQHLGQRRVPVPEVLELDQLREQRIHLALVFGRRHEEQDAVEVAFLRNDALFAQVVGQHRGWHTEVEILAGLAIDARREQHELVRVDHGVAVGVAGIAVPGIFRIEHPALLFALEYLGGH